MHVDGSVYMKFSKANLLHIVVLEVRGSLVRVLEGTKNLGHSAKWYKELRITVYFQEQNQ